MRLRNEFLDLRGGHAGYEAPDRAKETRKDKEGVAWRDEARASARKEARRQACGATAGCTETSVQISQTC